MLVLLPGVARSLQATLEDGSPVNTKMRIETVTPSPYPYGVYYWDVEGIEHLQRQWFWYRIGSSPESNVASVPHFSAPVMNDTTGEGYDDQLVAVYQDPIGLRIRVILTLRGNGAGSHEAWVTESIKLQNLTSSPMNLAFFQYTDFNLNSNPADDQLELFGPSLANARHEDSMTVVTQKITGHLPVEAEVDVVDGIGDILARMGDANPSSLSNTAGPVGGDGSYAYRWNFSLGSSGSPSDSVDFDIEKRIESLPPPVLPVGSSFLYVLGALGLGGAARYTLRR
ncbi:hypothetical protein MK489_06840 [Myxococcota bacterium]|nr:hypothetical protein [Myxococcota bacterium]